MESGEHGVIGRHVVKRVVEAHKKEPDHATIRLLHMVGMTVPMTDQAHLTLWIAILTHALVCNCFSTDVCLCINIEHTSYVRFTHVLHYLFLRIFLLYLQLMESGENGVIGLHVMKLVAIVREKEPDHVTNRPLYMEGRNAHTTDQVDLNPKSATLLNAVCI